jgi:hypothetical protein
MGDQKLDEEKIRRIHKMVRSEFPNLRSPGTAENGNFRGRDAGILTRSL